VHHGTLHRLVRRNFQRRHTVVSGVDDQWPTKPTSFFNTTLRRNGITFLTAQNHETKSYITEQMIRRLLSRIWRYFTFNDTERYVDVLPDFHDPLTQHFIAA